MMAKVKAKKPEFETEGFAMKLDKLRITNFRCFESLEIPLQPDVNVFVGVNGSGKTAILDAIAIALCDVVIHNRSKWGCIHDFWKKRQKKRKEQGENRKLLK